MLKETMIKYGFKDNENLNQYLKLINNEMMEENEFQIHHVIPVCWYKHNYKINKRYPAEKLANEDKSNEKVKVSYKKHILIHYYLSLCCPEYLKFGLEESFLKMTNRVWKLNEFDPKTSLKEFENIYIDWLKRKGVEHKGKLSGTKNPMYGKHQSKQTKEKMSQNRKGKCSGDKNPMYGVHLCGEKSGMFGKRGYKNSLSKQIAQLDLKTGEIINVFGGEREAERQLKISHGCIGRACKTKGKSHGYGWRYLNEE